MSKQIEKIFSNWQLETWVYMKLLMIIGLRVATVETAKILLLRVKYSLTQHSQIHLDISSWKDRVTIF
jgi:hypothetical protein